MRWLWITWLCASSFAAAVEKPYIVVVVADWGMQEKLHNAIEPVLPASYTLALNFLGKKNIATGQRTLLIQVPTLQDIPQGQTYYNACTEETRKCTKGIWIEANDGESAYPTCPIPPYLVLSQPPLHPNPPQPNDNTIMGHFWVPTTLPITERQKIYSMALGYAQKAGGCVLSVTFATQEAWDDFQKWVALVNDKVRWITLNEHAHLMKKKAPHAAATS